MLDFDYELWYCIYSKIRLYTKGGKNMKLKAIYDKVEQRVTEKIDAKMLEDYIKEVAMHGDYRDLSVRIPNDVKIAVFKASEVCEWYDKYDCNDNHITTLFRKIIQENYREAWRLIIAFSKSTKW